MPNPYSVSIKGIISDGTNIYVEMAIFNGSSTSPSFFPMFPVGTTAGVIQAYAQVIANNQPALDPSLGALVNTTVAGA